MALDESVMRRLEADHVRRVLFGLGLDTPGHMQYHDDQADDLTKSPIERLFYLAWCSLASARDSLDKRWHFHPQAPDHEHDAMERQSREPPRDDGIHDYLWSQHNVGKYVADFVIVRMWSNHNGWRRAIVAVECDGKDFHDATAAQANRDRERDRIFQELGVPVFRFSGSELYRDFAACVDQVDNALDNALNQYPYRQFSELGAK